MRNTFIDTLVEEAKLNENIYIITPDLGFSVLERFGELFPDRLINVGIAEQNAVGIAAGLALSGKIVYVYSIVPFVTMRCFEQVRVDVAYMMTNVRLVGVGAGLSYGPAGATHHSIEDIAIMRALPNMTVCCPGDPIEVREIIRQSVTYQGPMYIRLGKNGEPKIHNEQTRVQIGKAIEVVAGKDVAILTTSNMLEAGSDIVKKLDIEYGKSATLISVATIKPLDLEVITRLINTSIPIITLEEHNIIGGLGSAVSEVIAESGKAVPFKRFGIKDEYSHYVGSHSYLREKFIFDSGFLDAILALIQDNEVMQ
ncbi:1-deoxy-D-xylulose-5-phosphate synthase [Paenibacillus marchantiophytorum]|uniref:1-deoxy-D-xylulose-5-phosphate synthase n=1 Tax=Paenibacillus marchantiophytorum TaxID=1619310 RepID=A0ABQ2BRZ6_9BACL|nr:transketolase C-terminal domain-containing protein [Paenibacillus marchantiophytorum]GGI46216.1 1-deoxy-D-xylulose-5-phosphate synthase [Paenibacillus marchantiophytorum]